MKEEKKLNLPQSLLLLVLIIFSVAVCIRLKTGGPMIGLFASWIFIYLVCKIVRIPYDNVVAGAYDAIRMVVPTLCLLMAIGVMIGTWLQSGTIATIIAWGLKMINPAWLLPLTLLFCSVLSVVTGTSYGSVGSAGVAITKLLLTYGFSHITMCDISGILGKDSQNLNWMQKKMVEVTNLEGKKGTLADALNGADIFVGVSAPNIVTKEMVASMNKDAILFAMANPVPEIMPDLAKEAGAKIVGTGRSDFPNQVNNVVAFPGIFKGALEGRATQITEEMKLAAAEAIASLVSDEELDEEHIMPEAFNPKVAEVVAAAVKAHIQK